MSRDTLSPTWLPGGHLQTIVPFLRKGALPIYRRERMETPDGDFIDLDWLDEGRAREDPDAPLLVLFHGLEGSSASHYARSLMRAAGDAGWRGVVAHFRGCSGEPNRLVRAYHSGDADEIDWILRCLHTRAGRAPLHAAGVSLGGNALLKWLGEREAAATDVLRSAAAICAPLDLTLSGHALARGFNRIYTHHFLATLIAKADHKHARFPGSFDIRRARAAHTLHAFDDAYTGPVHGFRNADDYWRRASSKPWLGAIRVPTLVLNAANDPFVPPAALPTPEQLARAVTFECTEGGGHVGFIAGAPPGRTDWLAQRILAHCRDAGV